MVRLRTEPAVVSALVAAVITLAVAFGLPLTAQQIGAINALVVVAAGVFIRSKVTPV